MRNETHDILADKRRHIGQVLMMIANYCRKQRMLDFDLRSLPPEALDQIGNEIVDLFSDRVRLYQNGTPTKAWASGCESNSDGGGNSEGNGPVFLSRERTS